MTTSNTRRLQTTIPDLYALDSIIPEHLKGNTRFRDFIEEYLEWQQEFVTSPSYVINNLTEIRDIDSIADEFLEYIQKEVAAPFPNVNTVDKRKLYKAINDIYRSKGSTPSFEALFNLIYNDQIELYFPRVDMLKLSEGKWDNTAHRYLDNNGFLSDRKYIQDSYYYQDYSYVIKTSKTYEVWKDVIQKFLHPAGFIFFGQIKIISIAKLASLKMPMVQPGSAQAQPTARPLYSETQETLTPRLVYSMVTIPYPARAIGSLDGTWRHTDQYKFYLNEVVSQFNDVVINDAVEGVKKSYAISALGSLEQSRTSGYTTTTIIIDDLIRNGANDLGLVVGHDMVELEEPIGSTVTYDLE